MNRVDRLMQGMTKDMLGIEVAPWLAAIAPRRDGWNLRILDVFDTETLKARGQADPQQAWRDISKLEEVDFVGSATEIAALVPPDLHGAIDYIVSSHNFEHLPNPIKFLQGCEAILVPGGALTMAVPDKRGCFDVFRPLTELGDWIEAMREDRRRPSPRQVFSKHGSFAGCLGRTADDTRHSFRIGERAERMAVMGDLFEQYDIWCKSTPDDDYQDAHCTVMTPASLQLLLLEARQLGLIGLDLEWIDESGDFEFYLRLRKPGQGASFTAMDADTLRAERTKLLQRILVEQAAHVVGPRPLPWPKRASRHLRAMGRRLRGKPDW